MCTEFDEIKVCVECKVSSAKYDSDLCNMCSFIIDLEYDLEKTKEQLNKLEQENKIIAYKNLYQKYLNDKKIFNNSKRIREEYIKNPHTPVVITEDDEFVEYCIGCDKEYITDPFHYTCMCIHCYEINDLYTMSYEQDNCCDCGEECCCKKTKDD